MKYILISISLFSFVFSLNYHGCTLAPDNQHGWVVCLDTVLILRTTDGGQTWTPQDPPDTTTKRFFDVTCVNDLEAWTCGILGEITHTTNGGITWEWQVSGLSKYATRIEFIDALRGWAACGDGTFGRTTNSGSFWEQIFTMWPSAEFYGISFLDWYDGWAVSGFADSLYPGQAMVVRTTDGGLDWYQLYHDPLSYEDFFDLHFFNVLEGIVVGGNETDFAPLVLRTTDGGYAWDTLSVPGNTYYLRAVDFVGEEGWAVGRFGTIIYSADSGKTWTFQDNPAVNTLFDVDFSDNLHGLACGDGIILYTTDGGQNWNGVGIEANNEQKQGVKNQLEISPNPFSRLTNIYLGNILSTDPVMLNIYNTTGRLIKSFNPLESVSSVSWYGDDNAGRPVPQGIYFVCLQSNSGQTTEKIIFQK